MLLDVWFVVWGLWFGVCGLGFVVWGLGLGFVVWGLGFVVWGLRFGVSVSLTRVAASRVTEKLVLGSMIDMVAARLKQVIAPPGVFRLLHPLMFVL